MDHDEHPANDRYIPYSSPLDEFAADLPLLTDRFAPIEAINMTEQRDHDVVASEESKDFLTRMPADIIILACDDFDTRISWTKPRVTTPWITSKKF